MFYLGKDGRGKQYVPRPQRPPGWLAAMTPAGGDQGLDKSQQEGALALFSYLRGRAQTRGASATKRRGNAAEVTFFTVTSAKTGIFLDPKGVANMYPAPPGGESPTRQWILSR